MLWRAPFATPTHLLTVTTTTAHIAQLRFTGGRYCAYNKHYINNEHPWYRDGMFDASRRFEVWLMQLITQTPIAPYSLIVQFEETPSALTHALLLVLCTHNLLPYTVISSPLFSEKTIDISHAELLTAPCLLTPAPHCSLAQIRTQVLQWWSIIALSILITSFFTATLYTVHWYKKIFFLHSQPFHVTKQDKSHKQLRRNKKKSRDSAYFFIPLIHHLVTPACIIEKITTNPLTVSLASESLSSLQRASIKLLAACKEQKLQISSCTFSHGAPAHYHVTISEKSSTG